MQKYYTINKNVNTNNNNDHNDNKNNHNNDILIIMIPVAMGNISMHRPKPIGRGAEPSLLVHVRDCAPQARAMRFASSPHQSQRLS